MAQRLAGTAMALVLAVAPVFGADYPLHGDFLQLSSRMHPGMSRIRFGATGGLSDLRERESADPSVTGAILEVIGDGVMGADAPPVTLPAANWRALGDPPGSRGFRYVDRSARFGVRRLSLRFGTVMSFSLTAGGPGWPYRTTGLPGTVMVRLGIADDAYCAAFGTFERRRRGALVAQYNPPPASCTIDTPNG